MIYRLIFEKFEKGASPTYAECETDEQDIEVIIRQLAEKIINKK
jgi:hypothetical protein